MNNAIRILCLTSIFTWGSPLSKWTEFRLAEMFSLPNQSGSLEAYFTPEAFEAYQNSLAQEAVLTPSGGYHIVLQDFLAPIEITDAKDGKYAHAKLMLHISNTYNSWLLPVEMILTINTEDGENKITHFEGITSSPLKIKQYQHDRVAQCP